jgi:nickel-dependent lactate racemase
MANTLTNTTDFTFGTNRKIAFDFPSGVLVADLKGPPAASINATTATTRAIEAPLDFPPLRQAIVPGDRIVLALAPGVPEGPKVVAAIVTTLTTAGAVPEDITVVRTPQDVANGVADPRAKLPAEIRERVLVQTHNAVERNELSYLAADAQGEPIYLNRRLCDADFVLPIGRIQPSPGSNGKQKRQHWNNTLFPCFADRKAIDHFAPTGVPLSAGQREFQQKHIDQVAWHLGVQLTVQVVPGANDEAFAVLAGTPQAVFWQGAELYRKAWQTPEPQRVDLVISGISGGAPQQIWGNVSDALEAALKLVNDGGAVVLCTELDTEPGAALKHLADAADSEEAEARLRKQRTEDAPLARQLAALGDRATVFFLSRLPEATVSSLGFSHVAAPEEIVRLASRHDSCILIENGQYARPYVVGE